MTIKNLFNLHSFYLSELDDKANTISWHHKELILPVLQGKLTVHDSLLNICDCIACFDPMLPKKFKILVWQLKKEYKSYSNSLHT